MNKRKSNKSKLWEQVRERISQKEAKINKINNLNKISGGPRRIRTPDPLIRSQVLYPAELSVHYGAV